MVLEKEVFAPVATRLIGTGSPPYVSDAAVLFLRGISWHYAVHAVHWLPIFLQDDGTLVRVLQPTLKKTLQQV